MKRTGTAIMAIMICISTPVQAVGVGDLAKVVLGGASVLKKGEEKCGAALGLTRDDSLAITLARSAVEQTLPLSQLTTLDNAAKAEAAAAANNPTFCPETKKKKSGLMKAISKAGKSILKKKALGGLGL